MSHNFRIISIFSLVALAACGGGTGPYGASGGNGGGGGGGIPPGTIAATPSETFTPRTLTITAGSIATFAFGSLGHNVTFDTRTAATPADIPGVNSNVSISRTFATAGSYNYHCTIHPQMTGTVVVN